MEIALLCPECGGAFSLKCEVQMGSNMGANPAQAQIAHGSEVQVLKPSPKRAQTYNQDYDQEFLRFWKAYPIKRSKRDAQIAWRKAIHRATAGAILEGATRYRDDPNRLPSYTMYAEGWLNGDCWEDEPLPARNSQSSNPVDLAYHRAIDGMP